MYQREEEEEIPGEKYRFTFCRMSFFLLSHLIYTLKNEICIPAFFFFVVFFNALYCNLCNQGLDSLMMHLGFESFSSLCLLSTLISYSSFRDLITELNLLCTWVF